MEQIFLKYIKQFFNKLIVVYGFQKKIDLNEDESFIIKFSSDNFVIKIEKYFREFYLTLYKLNKQNSEINLFNLLEYIGQGNLPIPKSEYFHDEKNIEECYKKQLTHLSTILYENYDLLNDFFNENNYELNIIEFEKYWKNKYPEFY